VTYLIGILANVVSSYLNNTPLLFALPLLIFCVLASLYFAAKVLQLSGKETVLGEDEAPITIWRVFAGVCFLLGWSFVILIAWSYGSFWLSNFFQPYPPMSFGTPPPEYVYYLDKVIVAIFVIGVCFVVPISIGIYLIKKDHERCRKLGFPGKQLGFSETRVLVLVLLVIFNVLVVICIGVLSWMANVMEVAAHTYNIGGGCCSYPDYFMQAVGTMRIFALAVAIGTCVLHYTLFLLHEV
jgi:hypothetical protein